MPLLFAKAKAPLQFLFNLCGSSKVVVDCGVLAGCDSFCVDTTDRLHITKPNAQHILGMK